MRKMLSWMCNPIHQEGQQNFQSSFSLDTNQQRLLPAYSVCQLAAWKKASQRHAQPCQLPVASFKLGNNTGWLLTLTLQGQEYQGQSTKDFDAASQPAIITCSPLRVSQGIKYSDAKLYHHPTFVCLIFSGHSTLHNFIFPLNFLALVTLCCNFSKRQFCTVLVFMQQGDRVPGNTVIVWYGILLAAG